MRLSQKADYAMRMMVDLAYMSDGQRITIGEISQRQDVPRPFMAKIAWRAASGGLVNTQRGTGGGLALAQPPGRITLLQIVEAIDGPIAFARCTLKPGRCPRFNKCAMQPIWQKAKQQLEELLSTTLLSEIAQAQKALA